MSSVSLQCGDSRDHDAVEKQQGIRLDTGVVESSVSMVRGIDVGRAASVQMLSEIPKGIRIRYSRILLSNNRH